jgi:hypothetical protein
MVWLLQGADQFVPGGRAAPAMSATLRASACRAIQCLGHRAANAAAPGSDPVLEPVALRQLGFVSFVSASSCASEDSHARRWQQNRLYISANVITGLARAAVNPGVSAGRGALTGEALVPDWAVVKRRARRAVFLGCPTEALTKLTKHHGDRSASLGWIW